MSLLRRMLRNPATEYAVYVANCVQSTLRFRKLQQHYLALIFDSTLESNVTLFERSLVSNSKIGRHTYVGAGSKVNGTTLGRFCSIGPGCRFGLGRHPVDDFVSTHPIFYSTAEHTGTTFAARGAFEEYAPINVGHDVWIGANAVIIDGVDIGDGAIVAAGAVVTKSVPPYAVVGGVPAKVLRYRFDDATIARLQTLRWWERDDAWLREHHRELHDVGGFVGLTLDERRREPSR